MNKEEFIKVMTATAKIYDRELDQETLEIWLSFFKEDNIDNFKNAVNEHIRTNNRFPTIADIRKIIANNKTKNIPQAEDEWGKVIELVHKYGSYNIQDALNEMKDYTKYIVQHIGYIRICNATEDEQKWNKKDFVEEYNAMKDKQVAQLQIRNKEINLIGLKEDL